MLVALLSDIHDHTTHLLPALCAAKQERCSHLLFMGDMAGFSTFRTLREEWGHHIDLVFGNNEYEITAFQRAALQWHRVSLHGEYADITLDGRRIYFCHLPWTADKAAESGRYDAVFYGHTHIPEVRMHGSTLVANPGEVYGRQGKPTIGIYDTETNSVRIVNI